MELNKIPTLVVGLVVAILIITVVAIPIINDAQTGLVSQADNTTERYTSIVTTEKIVLSENSEGSPMINNRLITDIVPSSNVNYVMVVSDNLIARSINNSGIFSTWYYVGANGEGVAFDFIGSSINNPIVCTFEDGTYSLVKSATTTLQTGTYSTLLIPSETGNWGSFIPSESAPMYANTDKKVLFIRASSSESYVSIGTIDNLVMKWHVLNGTQGDNTDVSVIYTSINENGMDLYKVTGLNNNFAYLFAPISYTTITNDDATIRTIVGITPLLLIVSLVISVVGVAIGSRFQD